MDDSIRSSKKAFDEWILRKDVFDRGLNLLGRMDEGRWDFEDDWKKLTLALVAIDETIGIDVKHVMQERQASDPQRKCMYHVWKKNSMEKHILSDVILSQKDLEELSETILQYCEDKEVDLPQNQRGMRKILPKCQYAYPPEPKKKGDQVKPLSRDQKVQNRAFLRTLRRKWLDARDGVLAKSSDLAVSLLDKQISEEKQDGDVEPPSAEDLRLKALMHLGIFRLAKWVEADRDKIDERQRAETENRRREAIKEHESYVHSKKTLQLHLPNNQKVEERLKRSEKPPRFVFSGTNGTAPLRPKATRLSSTTFDLMKDSGMRVVHARRGGSIGGNDLEKSREQVLEEFGYIHKGNFDDENDYFDALEQRRRPRATTFDEGERVQVRMSSRSWVNAVVKEVEDHEHLFVVKEGSTSVSRASFSDVRKLNENEKQKAASDAAYRDWLEKKRSSEVAVDSLKYITPPELLVFIEDGVERQATEPEAVEHWKKVGKALKVIDLSLLDEWAAWSRAFGVSGYVCQVLWDSFEPRGDDVHTTQFSLARQAIQKLLRVGVPFREAVENVIKRKWRRICAQKDIDYDLEDAPEDERQEVEMLDRKDLAAVCKYLGIDLKKEEARVIVDAFDDQDVGMMAKSKFLNFVGPNGPECKADISKRMEMAPPIWESVCPLTGLANAFRIITLDKRKMKTELLKSSQAGRVTIKKNKQFQEARRKVELKERQQRIDILLQFGEITQDQVDDMDANDEYADDEQDFGVRECDLAVWKKDDGLIMRQKRAKALKQLSQLAAEKRDEEELQRLMKSGVPPAAPAFTALTPDDLRVRGDSLENSLLLTWTPPDQSLVAFFSIEMSGAKGSKNQRENQFEEVCRDPPVAGQAFAYQTWIRGLDPGTTYTFRIRAINGFGPGPYNWEDFTTRPCQPSRPRIVSRSPRTVTIAWLEDPLSTKIQELEEHFSKTLIPGETMDRDDLFDRLLDAQSSRHLLGTLGSTLGPTGRNSESLRKWIVDEMESHCPRTVTKQDIPSLMSTVRRLAKARSSTSIAPGGELRYAVERCESMIDRKWERLLVTKFGSATISSLEPDTVHRFRIVALNVNRWESKPSPSIVTSTFLETPPSPEASEIDTSAVRLEWGSLARAMCSGLTQQMERKNRVDRLMSEWTGQDVAEDGPVSLTALFQFYNAHPRGSNDLEIAGSQLGNILADLGVEATPERIAEVWEELGGYDTISLSDLTSFWSSNKLIFEVIRTSQADPTESRVRCYRGPARAFNISGLQPNARYSFSVRLHSPKSQSRFSKCTSVLTLPLAPVRLGIIRSSPGFVSLKWHANNFGAAKFRVEAKLIEALDGSMDRSTTQQRGQKSWRTIFEGTNNLTKVSVSGGGGSGFLTNSVYRVRAYALNSEGNCSPPSDPILCRTHGRASAESLRPSNALDFFTVECTGDIVPGDTILFTEKVTSSLSKTVCGERTVAADVIACNVQKRSDSKSRMMLRLEVIWSTVSTDAAKDLYFKKGTVIERTERTLSEFEIFRTRWEDEGCRHA